MGLYCQTYMYKGLQTATFTTVFTLVTFTMTTFYSLAYCLFIHSYFRLSLTATATNDTFQTFSVSPSGGGTKYLL